MHPLRGSGLPFVFLDPSDNSGLQWARFLRCRTLTRPTTDNYATAAVALRTANDSITRVTPLMIMLTPTKMPIAQAELDGHCR